MGLKPSGCHLQSGQSDLRHKSIKKFFGDIRRRGIGETGAAPLARAGQQRKLAYQQQFALDIQRRQIEFTIGIIENTELRDFIYQLFDIFLPIAICHADKYH